MAKVAPYVGAWIETNGSNGTPAGRMSHPTWVRGLKQAILPMSVSGEPSHPTWVRGLKPPIIVQSLKILSSHPTWVRGLKLNGTLLQRLCMCRTLRGCVD